MRRLAPWFLLLSALVVLQSGPAHLLQVGLVRPDFFLLAVMILAMKRGGEAAVALALPAGLLQDILSGGTGVFNLVTKPAVGMAVGLIRPKLDFDNPNTQSVAALAATAVEGLFQAMFLEAAQPDKRVMWTLSTVVLPASLYHAIFLPVVIQGGVLLTHTARRWRRRIDAVG